MNIVLLESLGISPERLSEYARPLVEAGHTFNAYPRDLDIQVQIERAREADVIIIANMPLRGEVIRACKHLKFIDVAFTGVDHVDLDAARECGVKVSNAAGYSTQAVAELALCMMLSLLRNVRKHSVNHVFSSPTSIINFTSKKPSYDDTRRSGRDNELLQRAQSDL